MFDDDDPVQGFLGCLAMIFIFALQIAAWLLPIWLAIWILQSSGCVD